MIASRSFKFDAELETETKWAKRLFISIHDSRLGQGCVNSEYAIVIMVHINGHATRI